MILYAFYRIGYFLAMSLPISVSYGLARLMGSASYHIYSKERKAIISNLKLIFPGDGDEKRMRRLARSVFVNFAKYLVDFFRFSRVDEAYIKKFVKIDGLKNVDEALSRNKGAILLSAHIGNWELGGIVSSLLRQPMGAVVLTHTNRKINDFFIRQRAFGNLKSIEIGLALRECFRILKNNGLLALLGDRDFSKNGVHINFFGKPTLIPKGPAVFSCRIGSAIVPVFMIREADDTFRLTFERPIYPDAGQGGEARVKQLIEQYSYIIESYVRRYPDQWYMFREVWNSNGNESLRPDTVL